MTDFPTLWYTLITSEIPSLSYIVYLNLEKGIPFGWNFLVQAVVGIPPLGGVGAVTCNNILHLLDLFPVILECKH